MGDYVMETGAPRDVTAAGGRSCCLSSILILCAPMMPARSSVRYDKLLRCDRVHGNLDLHIERLASSMAHSRSNRSPRPVRYGPAHTSTDFGVFTFWTSVVARSLPRRSVTAKMWSFGAQLTVTDSAKL